MKTNDDSEKKQRSVTAKIREKEAEKVEFEKEKGEQLEEFELRDKHMAGLVPAQNKYNANSIYSEDLANKICALIAAGVSLRQILKMPNMPARPTLYKWLGENRDFLERYNAAYNAHFDEMADELLEIADEQHVVSEVDEEGNSAAVKMDSALVAWQANRIKVRQWILERRAANKFGRKISVEQNVSVSAELAETLAQIGSDAMSESKELYDKINERRARMGLPTIDKNGNEIIEAETAE